jgi:hypothetical protein
MIAKNAAPESLVGLDALAFRATFRTDGLKQDSDTSMRIPSW